VPMQFFILLVGVMVFVFYQFNQAPLNFNPAAHEAVLNSDYAGEYRELMETNKSLQDEKQFTAIRYGESLEDPTIIENDNYLTTMKNLDAAEIKNRERARELIKAANGTVETNDKDYVFIHFILNNLPRGLIGLLLAVILSAAMSSTASELNALGSTTTIDLYKRNVRKEKTDEHFVKMSKLFTLGWGIVAIIFASFASLFDNLIQLVNIIGSIFYGNVLGIFLLAFFIKQVKSNAVFIAALITQTIVVLLYMYEVMPYLWLNLVGCLLVMVIAYILQGIIHSPGREIATNETEE
ncbi:MAG TPA: hypothetical protein VK916_02250, partial [Gillisia sp.]|nr:hypothetical protein [Gillisia sp.]